MPGASDDYFAPTPLVVTSGAPAQFNDSVDEEQFADFFSFTLGAPSIITITLDGMSADADLLLDPIFFDGELRFGTLATSENFDSQSEFIQLARATGTYLISVVQFEGDTNYQLNVSAVATSFDQAGNRRGRALNLCVVGDTPRQISDRVSSSDPVDWFRIQLSSRSNLSLDLTGLRSDANLVLLRSDGETVVRESHRSGTRPESIDVNGVGAGTYYVQVLRVRGSTNYTLEYVATPVPLADNGGDTPLTATNLGLIGATAVTRSAAVGSFDSDDYFLFSSAGNSDLSVALDRLSGPVVMQVLDASDGALLGDNLDADQVLLRNMPAGDYLVHVAQFYGNAEYRLSVRAPATPDSAGGTLATARNLTTIGRSERLVVEPIAPGDEDYFRFQTSSASNLFLSLSALQADVDVQLLDARGAVIATSANPGYSDEVIQFNGLAAGVYFVRVFPAGGNTLYDLRLSAQPPGFADDSLTAPRDVGVVGTRWRTFVDFVGTTDPRDVFRFSTASTSDFRASLSGLAADADIRLFDADGNLLGESLAPDNESELIQFPRLSAGTYRVEVRRFEGNTDYTLGLRALAPVSLDPAGATPNTARQLGIISARGQVVHDAIGASDGTDMFAFSLDGDAIVRLAVDQFSDTAAAAILASNGSTTLGSASLVDGGLALELNLAAGNYFARVSSSSLVSSNYRLNLRALHPGDGAGDTPETANDLGTLTGTPIVRQDAVDATDVSDWYHFNLAQPAHFIAELDELQADADIFLFAADGETILASSLNVDDIDETISEEALAPGDYYLLVSQYEGDTDYRLSLRAEPPEDLAGDTPAAARLINLAPVAARYDDAVGDGDSNDYYKFTLGVDSTVSLLLTDLSGDADIEIRDSADQVVADAVHPGNGDELIQSSLAAGTYFIRVLVGAGEDHAEYSLVASAVPENPPDFAGNTLSTARLIAVGTVATQFSDYIAEGDSDFYRFSLSAASGLVLELNAGVAAADLAVFNAAGAPVAAWESSETSTSERLVIGSLAAGTYYVGVSLDQSPGGFYRFAAQRTPVDDFGANPARAGAITVGGAARQGSIESAGDVDWFGVTLQQGVRYNLRARGASSGNGTLVDPAIEGVFDAAGNPIAFTANDDVTFISLDAGLRFTQDATGTFYLAVRASANQVGTYRVSVDTSNLAPLAGASIGTQSFDEGRAFSIVLPWQLFIDPDGEPLVLTAGLSNGQNLPAWLNFDPEANLLSGTPPANGPDLTVRITATDPHGASAFSQFLLQTPAASSDDFAANASTLGTVPVGGSVQGNIESAGDSDWFRVSLTQGTSYTIDLRGSSSGGGSLLDPFILGVFDSNSQLLPNSSNDDFSSLDARVALTAPASGDFFIAAGAFAGARGTYTLSVSGGGNQAPLVNALIPDQEVREDRPFSFQFAADSFTDPEAQPLTYTARTHAGAALPAWLSFDASSRTFAGTPPIGALDVGVRVTATDPGGLSVSDTFVLRTGNANGELVAQWTIMVYLAADNNLEYAAIDDLNEMELAGLPNNVRVAVLVDRIGGFDSSNGNWTDTRIGLISNDADAARIGSALTSIGEQNTGSPSTLTNFIDWAASNFQAQRYGLVIWDHGGGLSGTSWDDTNGSANLSIAETSSAIRNSVLGEFDFIGFDTCLKGMVEQVVDLRQLTDVVVASENLEPGDGWDYTAWLRALAANPGQSAQQLAIAAVETYEDFYANQFDGDSTTLSAVDTSLLDELTAAIDVFADTASAASAADIQRLRSERSQATILDSGSPNFRDLGDFMLEITGNGAIAADIRAAAAAVTSALDAAVISHTTLFPNTHGLTINLPGTRAAALDPSYSPSNYRFLGEASWRDFLLALNPA